jgi:hypothetical protein
MFLTAFSSFGREPINLLTHQLMYYAPLFLTDTHQEQGNYTLDDVKLMKFGIVSQRKKNNPLRRGSIKTILLSFFLPANLYFLKSLLRPRYLNARLIHSCLRDAIFSA